MFPRIQGCMLPPMALFMVISPARLLLLYQHRPSYLSQQHGRYSCQTEDTSPVIQCQVLYSVTFGSADSALLWLQHSISSWPYLTLTMTIVKVMIIFDGEIKSRELQRCGTDVFGREKDAKLILVFVKTIDGFIHNRDYRLDWVLSKPAKIMVRIRIEPYLYVVII